MTNCSFCVILNAQIEQLSIKKNPQCGEREQLKMKEKKIFIQTPFRCQFNGEGAFCPCYLSFSPFKSESTNRLVLLVELERGLIVNVDLYRDFLMYDNKIFTYRHMKESEEKC